MKQIFLILCLLLGCCKFSLATTYAASNVLSKIVSNHQTYISGNFVSNYPTDLVNDFLELRQLDKALQKKYIARNKVLMLLLGICLFTIGGLLASIWALKRKMRENKLIHQYCGKEDLLKSLLNRRDLIVLLEHLDEHVERNKPLTINELLLAMDRVEEILPGLTWQAALPFIDINYNAMFQQLRYDFPMLNPDEFKACCLLFTKRFTDYDVALVMKLTVSEFEVIKKSIEHKLEGEGYTFQQALNHVRKLSITLAHEKMN